MSAISFVVRDVAGNISRGSVAGEGVPSSLVVGAGADISLNLSQGQIVSYTRQGQALEVTLIDGRVIVIEGYFTSEGVSENQLFLSSDGFLTEVNLTQGAGADYFANYLQDDGVGKFALNDDLYFMRGSDVMLADSFEPADDQVGMLGAFAPLLGWGGAAAAAGAAALVATTIDGGGDGGGGPAAPVVDVTTGTQEGDSHVVNEEDHADGVDIGGTGTPGATVDVTIRDVTETTTVGEDGTWEVTFDSDEVDTGEYTTDVDVTITNEGGSTEVTHTLVVDTIIGADMSATGGSDGVINLTEYGTGVTLSGTVTGNANGGDTVVVSIDGTEYEAVVTGNTWSLDASSTAITAGDYHTHDIVITATDAAGNSSSTTGTIIVDTVTTATISTSGVGGSDGVVFSGEHSGGVTLTGTAEAGSAVVLTLGTATHSFTAGDSGSWSYTFPASEVPTGEETLTATITATDAAGNVARDEGIVVIDTFVNELEITTNSAGGDDGVVNFNEIGQPITLTGTVEVGSTVSVNLGGSIMGADVNPTTGAWTVTYPGGTLTGGDYYSTTVVVTATDAAGNSSSLTEAVNVDTVVGDLALSTQPIEFDDVVNYDEASNGVIINGTATAGLIVTVGFGDATMDVLAQPNGTWSANFPAAQVPADTASAQITASITDAAGNYKEVSDTVEIDTVVSPFNFSAGQIEGNDIINHSEAQNGGVTFDGQVEAFSSVLVEFNGHSQTVNANGAGQWTATFTQAQIGVDEYTAVVKATATDPHDNVSQPITRTVEVDTLVTHLTVDGPVEGDDVVNFAEASNGVTLTGTVEARSEVTITYDYEGGQIVRDADVDANGVWSITYEGSEIPQGEYDVDITVDVTDRNGNTDSTTDSFRVDMVDPEAPLIENVVLDDDGVEAIKIAATDNDVTVTEITNSGATKQLKDQDDADLNGSGTKMEFEFDSILPNGSHLVVNETDSAGNTNATYLVLEEAGTNLVDMAGLGDFEIGAIDLSFAKDSELTLDISTLEGLSDVDNNLIIHGGDDDSVTINGAKDIGETTEIDGKSYDIYTMGDDAQIFIEDGVNVIGTI